MSNGFRQQPEASRKERLRNLEAEIKNSQMALRISQMMQQQMMTGMKNMSEDLGRALGLISEMQYKLLAIQSVASLDVPKLSEIANGLRLKDFNEASDKEDAENGFTVGTAVNKDSTVILTSKTEGQDKGIFRSKIKLAECGVPDLIAAFMDREVGAKALITLNGTEHEVELLGIRQPPAQAEKEQELAASVPAAEVAQQA